MVPSLFTSNTPSADSLPLRNNCDGLKVRVFRLHNRLLLFEQAPLDANRSELVTFPYILNFGYALDHPLTSFTTTAALTDALDPDAQPDIRYPLAPYPTPR